jgi:uncharacterized protein YjbI with pentapeptide repeats
VPTWETADTGVVAEDRDGTPQPQLTMQWLDGLVEFQNVTLADLDLSNSQLDHLRFSNVIVENCLFDKAKCRDWRGWNLTMEECSFDRAMLRDSALGTWDEGHGNHYRRVEFSRADLRQVGCEGAAFESCKFRNTRLDDVEFTACNFVDCEFEGLLDGVRFIAEPTTEEDGLTTGIMHNVDFSKCVLRWTEFQGIPLTDLRLPPEADHHVIVTHYPCVVRRAVSRLENELTADNRMLYARLLTDADQLDESASIGLWHRDELGETPEQQRFARELLHELDRQCAADEP